MTLIEMMASLLILVMLVMGMNAGMTAGLRVYQSSKETTDRAMLTSSINTTLSDILRYAQVRTANGKKLYSNLEYGLWDTTFETVDGRILVKFWNKTGTETVKTIPLIPSDDYSVFKVEVEDTLIEPKSDSKGNYYAIEYTLVHVDDETSQEISTVVRTMNE